MEMLKKGASEIWIWHMKQHVDSTVCIVGACFHGLPKQIFWKSNMWFKENSTLLLAFTVCNSDYELQH
jgi:hypothetical protein